ncbi:gliding motility lipoprotein GldH [Flavobacterium coralii]|uniref:gliding motility lipoprotein GldH n=1 Tax=Flavobacterium coralii TaxID=2838017 RepID=UPI000C3FA822|nr:gliding motility lipoprotein GldH [Flavobacterium coralii]MBF00461.1 gliding motility lipoprotein GldH [Flavobacterium sp.]MBY8963272.1 gliding motility lipoprotein GldH [Flavobacterium coralii]|tara:strand:- start:141 stop:629 length:489 start_codon:yes stop_codon:yes gene_type:complete
MKIRHSIFLFAALLLFCSCDKKRVFDEYKEFDGTWNKDSIVSFEFEQQDTVKLYNMFINIRNNNDYPFSNLYLIVEMQEPGTDVTQVDTLEYQMAEADGTLLGEGMTDIKESKLWYKEKQRFPTPGKYKVNIQQAVREAGQVPGVQELEGVMEVGFRIETTE